MVRRGRRGGLLEGYIKPKAVFYGYVLGYYIGVRWNMSTNGGMGNPKLYELVRKYLTYTCETDEWAKRQVLDVIRERNRNGIRDVARDEFPSLFPKGRQKPLQVPEELNNQDIKFDIDFVNALREEVLSIKKENSMNAENATENETKATSTRKATTVVVPEGVDLDSLTLDNFREITGKRFRMTKDQKARNQAGILTREGALAEFIQNLKKGVSTNESE